MTAYSPTVWQNNVPPPLSAANLNKLTDELEAQATAKSISHTLPTWIDGTTPALTDAAPLNEMERVAAAVASVVGLSYTPTVWQGGWTPTRNAYRLNRLEAQVQANRAQIDGQPSGTIYYVSTTGLDSNDGTTPAKAWLTVKHACDTVTSGTISVGTGTYSETATCTLKNGVSLVGAGIGNTTVRCASDFTPLIALSNSSTAQTISDLTLDGQSRTLGSYGLQVTNASNLTVTRIESKGWKGASAGAFIVYGASDLSISNCTFTNSGGMESTSSVGGCWGMRNLTRATIHDCVTSTDKSYAFKVPQGGSWTDVEFHNCSFAVSGDNPQNDWPGMTYDHYITFESFSNACTRCVMQYCNFDGIASLTGPEHNPSIGNPKTNGGLSHWRLHHNKWAITHGNRYCVEISNNSMEFDHNYISPGNGLYPLGYFEGQALSNDWVHHNVIDANTWTAPVTHIVTSMSGGIYEKNTVVSRQASWQWFNISSASSCQIRDSVFWATSSQGDKLATAAMLSGSTIDNNSFDNITAKGSNAKSGAGLTLSGWPSGYATSLSGIGAFADGSFTVGVQ